MARSAADLALQLDVLAGPDEWAEGVGYRLSLPPPRHDRLADFRILVIGEHPLCPTAASVIGAVDDLAERLGKRGCTILRSSAAMPDLEDTTRLYVELLAAAFIGPDLPPEVRQRLAAEAAALSTDDDSLRACRLCGILMPHNDWVMATRTRFGITARWRALFRDIDAILCPAMPTAAFPHDHSPIDERLLDIDGTAARYADQIVWATIATLNGLPATTLPIARSPDGLPIGAQLIGAFLEDRTTIALAGMIECELGCAFTRPPGY